MNGNCSAQSPKLWERDWKISYSFFGKMLTFFFVSFLASFRLNFIMVWAVSTIAELVLHNYFQKGNEVLWVKRRNWSKWYFPIAAKFKKLNKAKVYMIEFALRAGGFVETKPACCNIAFPVSFLQPTKPNRANQKWEKQGWRWPDENYLFCNNINLAFNNI